MKRRVGWLKWVLACLVVGAGLVALVANVTLPVGPTRQAGAVQPSLEVIVRGGDGDRVLDEQLALFDPTPLFLAGGNSTVRQINVGEVARGQEVFTAAIPAQLKFQDAAPGITQRRPIAVPDGPSQALREGADDLAYFGFGTRDQSLAALGERDASIEISRIGSGKVVYIATIPLLGGDSIKLLDWEPSDWMVSIDRTGMIGAPALLKGSGRAEIDETIRRFLTEGYGLADRLPPGLYKIRIGP